MALTLGAEVMVIQNDFHIQGWFIRVLIMIIYGPYMGVSKNWGKTTQNG